MPRLMIGISGVRGVYGDGLTEEIAQRFACVFGQLYGKKVIVGRDSRVSGPIITQAVIEGLTCAGSDIIDLGIASTPTTEMAVVACRASGGIIITASHNPGEWNGLKFLGPDGIFLNASQGAELVKKYESTSPGEAASSTVSLSSWCFADDYHIEAVLDLDVIDRDLIASRGFTVCVDTVHGAGGSICGELLDRLGCTVHALYAEPTGQFPHGAEPVAENIGDLCSFVRECDADVGFAVDPDVDRLSIVNERGEALGEEYTLALAADYIMDKTGKPAACNLSTSRLIDDAAARHGSVVYRSPVGEINVVETMREYSAAIGGEGNGGVIFPSLHYGRDAVLGMALILQIMAERDKTVSALADEFPRYSMIKEKAAISAKGTWIEPLKAAFAGEKMDARDGIKIIFPVSWVHVRGSNTEPVVRIIAEAPTTEEAKGLVDKVFKVIGR
ncbi:phosphoglucosamine mutase [bacterium]|nr:phosphoglucosamine mutase [bacterium]